jgi:hypothetical protein
MHVLKLLRYQKYIEVSGAFQVLFLVKLPKKGDFSTLLQIFLLYAAHLTIGLLSISLTLSQTLDLSGLLVIHVLESHIPNLHALLPVLLHLIGCILLLVPLDLLELFDLDEGPLELQHGFKLYLLVGFLYNAHRVSVTL